MYSLDNVGRNIIAMVPEVGKGKRLTPHCSVIEYDIEDVRIQA